MSDEVRTENLDLVGTKGGAEPALTGRVAALEALVEGAAVVEAARRAEVNVRTVTRWLKEPEFARQMAEGRALVVRQAVARAQAALERSVAMMLAIVEDPQASAHARVRAARTLFEVAGRAESEELLRRLQEMERKVEMEATLVQRDNVPVGGRLFDAS